MKYFCAKVNLCHYESSGFIDFDDTGVFSQACVPPHTVIAHFCTVKSTYNVEFTTYDCWHKVIAVL